MWRSLRVARKMISPQLVKNITANMSTQASELDVMLEKTNAAWRTLLFSEWKDEPDLEQKITYNDSIVREYRAIYDPEAVEAGGDEKRLYDAVEQLYVTNEAAKTVELYADHFEVAMRDHMDMTGVLGNNTKISEDDAKRAEQSLKEYFTFVRSIKNNRIRRKVEAQLGSSVLQFRQALSIEEFGAKFGPLACDHIVTDTLVKSVPISAGTDPALSAPEK